MTRRRMTPLRRAEIEEYCASQVMAGRRQQDLSDEIGYSKSAISRFTVAGLRRIGGPMAIRHAKTGTASLTQMMWHRIEVGGLDECWKWTGGRRPNGYGTLNFRGVAHTAHRLVFETLVASIPEGYVIDHTCSNPGCVNPRHLQACPQTVNLLLGRERRRQK